MTDRRLYTEREAEFHTALSKCEAKPCNFDTNLTYVELKIKDYNAARRHGTHFLPVEIAYHTNDR